MASDIWPVIHAERAALAADLSDLTVAQWGTPSLCQGWTVHQVLGHVVSTAVMSAPRFLGGMISSGFSFGKFADRGVATQTAGGPAATLDALQEHLHDTTSPPGPKDTWVGEILVHGEDIRRPLGLKRDYPAAAVLRVLDFYKGSNAIIGTKKRIAGVQLKATDADWSHGAGPVAEGPAMSLLLAGAGRTAALDDLSGPGVEILRGR
jgi:uncharacterized protein (TIGR03083 family)